MRVVISQKYLKLSKRLAKESNRLLRGFSHADYSRVEDIEHLLLKRDISVEKKKKILMKELHNAAVKTFSLDKERLRKKTLDSLKKRLLGIRKLINKLRSVNYYLETLFFEDLKFSKLRKGIDAPKSRSQNAIAHNEIEVLEYAAYQLIGELVMLDKRLLSGYEATEKKITGKEKVEVGDLGLILGKESALMEHLEAKMPPPKAVSDVLLKEPRFTHWVARIFALLSCLEHFYAKEMIIFSRLKKNKEIKMKIGMKIAGIIKEKSKLVRVMEERAISMKKFQMDREFRNALHNLTTTMRL